MRHCNTERTSRKLTCIISVFTIASATYVTYETLYNYAPYVA